MLFKILKQKRNNNVDSLKFVTSAQPYIRRMQEWKIIRLYLYETDTFSHFIVEEINSSWAID